MLSSTKSKLGMKVIRTVGTVVKVLDKQNFHVCLKDGTIVITTMSSKVKFTMSKEISINEEVALEMSPYDRYRGRIIYKHPVMKKYF